MLKYMCTHLIQGRDRRSGLGGDAFPFAVGGLLALWLGAVIVGADSSLFHGAPEEPPLAILGALAGPPVVFLALLRLVPPLRARILAIDPVWLTAVQGLRILGVGFLFLHAFGHLPGLFAHPAGWGDLLVAVLAPFMAARLATDPAFLGSRALWRFHALGMLDFVGALGFGLLARGGLPALVDGVTTAPLGALPLALVPAFAVPLWICLHIAAFAQIRAARCT